MTSRAMCLLLITLEMKLLSGLRTEITCPVVDFPASRIVTSG